MTDLILASASPRRHEALYALGLKFQVLVSHAEDTLPPQPDPSDPVPIAVAKALDVAAQRSDAVILAGDTIVTVDGDALGKPQDQADALRMLRQLRGQHHAVRTGLALVSLGGGLVTAEVIGPLVMRSYSEEEIGSYVATGEPMDCAGAYDVHRLGGALIDRVEGCFSAIVGFPLVEAAHLLTGAGVDVPRDPARVCSRLYGRPCLAEDLHTAGACRSARPAQ